MPPATRHATRRSAQRGECAALPAHRAESPLSIDRPLTDRAMDTNDRATIRDTAAEIWTRISQSSALFLVTDPRGEKLGWGEVEVAMLFPAAAFDDTQRQK